MKFLLKQSILLVSLLFFLFGCFLFWHTAVDDTFINSRYAYNLANGHGLVFNIGEKEEGFSNPLWIFILAGASFIGVNIVYAAKALGVIAMIGVFVILHRVAIKIEQTGLIEWLLFLLFATLSGTIFWSVAGMETALYTLLLTAAVLALLQEARFLPNLWNRTFQWPLSSFLFGLLAITRPEGIFYVIAAAVLVVIMKSRGVQISLWRWGVCAFAPWVAMAVFRWFYFGLLLPLPVLAKASPYGLVGIKSGLTYVHEGLELMWPVLVLAITGIVSSLHNLFSKKGEQKYTHAILVLTLFIMGQTTFAVMVAGDWMPFTRFLVPVYPLIILLAILSWSNLKDYLPQTYRLTIATMLSVSLLVAGGMNGYQAIQGLYLVSWNGLSLPAGIFGMCLKERQFPYVPVGFEMIGIMPFASGLPIIDDHGLIQRDIAMYNSVTYPGDTVEQRAGRAELILRYNPQYFIGPHYTWDLPPIKTAQESIEKNQIPRQIFPPEASFQYIGTLLGRPTQPKFEAIGFYFLTFVRSDLTPHPAWQECIDFTHTTLRLDLDQNPIMQPPSVTGKQKIDEVLWLRKHYLSLYSKLD